MKKSENFLFKKLVHFIISTCILCDLLTSVSQAREKSECIDAQSILNQTAGTEAETSKSWNLTLCAMIRDEMPYIIEWIEHYRFQGVDRFLLYDDGSIDDTILLPHLYKSKGFDGLVELYPANPYRWNNQTAHVSGHHNQKQMYALDHCNRRSANRSKWVIVVDVDEFVYAPSHGSILKYIESKKNETEISPLRPIDKTISQFSVQAVRYGSSGIQKSFRGNIHNDPYTGNVKLVSTRQLYITRYGFPMIIQANPSRAPHKELDEDYDKVYNHTCRYHSDPNACQHAIGKSIWKPERCEVAGIHWCEKGLQGKIYKASTKELRLNHYAFKSREHVEGLIDLMKPAKKAAYDHFDSIWFCLRWDPMPNNIFQAVGRAVKQLQA
jgi:hypothetical protein